MSIAKPSGRLSLGCAFSDRIEALLDGRVAVQGVELDVRICQPQALFKDVLTKQTHDLAEMSLGSYLTSAATGQSAYVGMPIFLSRAFRHSNLYVRRDAGIARPADLRGKRIGMMDYTQTAAVWVRGLLSDDYGVARDEVQWVTGGLRTPALDDRIAFTPPHGVNIERTPRTLEDLLACGELDALISPQAPQAFRDGNPAIVRLFGDSRREEIAYYARTRMFPIMHCLVVRHSLVETDPGLPAKLMATFERARTMAAEDVRYRDYAKISLPWIGEHAGFVDETVGEAWTYGLAPNRTALETFTRYGREDGLWPTDFDPLANTRVFNPCAEAP